MASAFSTSVDIANRALQHVGARRITAFSDTSLNAAEASFLYDKDRQVELRRAVWWFATRRAALRAITATTVTVAPLAYDAGTTYAAGALVTDTSGAIWQSLVASNTGNTPADGSAFWVAYTGPITADAYSASVTYYTGEMVTSGGHVYLSLVNANKNNTPASSGADWLDLGSGASSTLTILLPLGFDPFGVTNKSLYRLPYGFLRLAPYDLKRASTERLAVSAGTKVTDWELSGSYLLSAQSFSASNGAWLLNYVANVTDVSRFEGLFCEGLACRMALNLVERLTQSVEKTATLSKIYDRFISEARKVNMIEQGSSEEDEMDYTPRFMELGQRETGGRQAQG